MILQSQPIQDTAELAAALHPTEGDPPGLWLGSGRDVLGLGPVVFRSELEDVFQGNGPRAPQQGPDDVRPKGQAGATLLSFAPPRSVAACWASAPPELRTEIGTAQFKAVRAALDYLEKEAAQVVDRKGRHHTAGLVAAAFERATVEGGRPQFHTQVVLCHVGTFGADGWSPEGLDLSRIHRHLQAANALYHAELSHQLRLRTGLHLERNGAALDLKDFPPAVTETLFSAQTAPNLGRDQLHAVWRTLALEKGLGEIRPQPPVLRPEPAEMDRRCAGVLRELTGHQNHFTAHEAVLGLARRCGGDLDARAVQGYARDKIVGRAVDRSRVGGEEVFRTRSQVDREADLTATLRERAAVPSHKVDRTLVPDLLQELDRKHQRAFIDLTLKSGSCVYLDRLKPGEQRDFIQRARFAWNVSGFRVVALGHDRDRLKTEFPGPFKSRQTVRSVLDRRLPGWKGHCFGSRPGLLGLCVDALSKIGSRRIKHILATAPTPGFMGDHKTVVLVDQAHRLDARETAALVRLAGTNGAKLVFVGDDRQVSPSPKKSPIRCFAEAGAVMSVGEPRPELAPARFESTLVDRAGSEKLVVGESNRELVGRWASSHGDGLLLAANAGDRRRLNALAQDQRQGNGELGGVGLHVGGETFHQGDRIVVQGRHEALRLKPGMSGTITRVDDHGKRPGVLVFRTDDGRRRVVPLAEFNKVSLGYAATFREALGRPAEKLYLHPTHSLPQRLLTALRDGLERTAHRPSHHPTKTHAPSHSHSHGR